MKKILVAAAMMACAASAFASNFRGGDQVYIPIAGHQAGGTALFISDVYLANLEPDTVKVSVIYQPLNVATNPGAPSTIGQEFADVITLRPYERKEYRDFFRTVLGIQTGFGTLILNGCKDGQNCGPDGQGGDGNSENYRNISAESRIYSVSTSAANPETAPTTGQLFSGIPWYNFVSMNAANVGLDKVFITGVTQTTGVGSYRTNFGFVNASQYSSTTLAVSLYKGTYDPRPGAAQPDRIGSEVLINLTPLENTQKNFTALFPNAPLGNDYFVVVEQRSAQPVPSGVPSTCDNACASFLAYGSVLDNATGDATTLEPQYLSALTQEVLNVLYPGAGKQPFRRAVRH